MVLTVTLEKEWKVGKIAHAVVKVTFDAAYLAGGESLDLSAYMKNIWYIGGFITEDEQGYVLSFDDTDFATAIALCMLAWADYDAVADGLLIDFVGDASSCSARIHAFGDAY